MTRDQIDAAPMPAGTRGPLRALLFDKDGTLFDFQATWAGWAEAVLSDLSRGDPPRAGAMAEAIGFDTAARRFRPGSVVIAGTAHEVATALARYVEPPLPPAVIVRRLDALAEGIVPAEAVPLAPLLDGLVARGLALAVVTNDSEAPATAHLARCGIDDRFGAIIGADSGHGGKPGAGPLLAAAARLGVPPGAAAMVGDSRHDLLAGRAAGMVTVGVLTGLATSGDLASLADVILPDIGALPAWLDGRPGRDGEPG